MSDKPILFSAPMVRALIEGRKTQTRRVYKVPPGSYVEGGRVWAMTDGAPAGENALPYAVGDRLYVREAWRATDSLDHLSPKQIEAAAKDAGYRGGWCPYITEADGVAHNWSDEDRGVPMFGAFSDEPGRFRQGMHMPRWASRLTLTVTDVRVQRVQEISQNDCAAEGIPTSPDVNAKHEFEELWNNLNASRGFGWDANPWVAAYTFTVSHGNIDA